MGELADQLGNKVAGQLIRSEDWNSLVVAVENLDTTLNQRLDDLTATMTDTFNTVDASISDLDQKVIQLQKEFTEFRTSVQPLLTEYYRVTLETSRVSYAIGEMAEITARVTDLLGNPLDLQEAATRPWIDFVTTWGQLKAVSGFESRGGAGDRTLSVRTNAQGIARVRLSSEHAEGFTEEAEEEVAASLTTKLPQANKSVAQIILEAATPAEAKNVGAFRQMTKEYDRTDAPSVRQYLDIYYFKNAGKVTDKFRPPFHIRWRDYRSTVLAFAKADSDPRSPDQSRGVSSIQVTFRDWISPWLILDYMEILPTAVQSLRDRLTPRITGDLSESVGFIKDEVKDIVRGKGLIGKQRDFQMVHAALDQITLPQPPDFFNMLTHSVQNAIKIQQTLENAQVTTFGFPDQEVAFEVFTHTAAQSDIKVAEVKSGLGALEQRIDSVQKGFNAVNTDVTNLRNSVSSLGGRVDATLAEGGEMQRLRSDLMTVSQKVEVLREIDPSNVHTKLLEVENLRDRVTSLERR